MKKILSFVCCLMVLVSLMQVAVLGETGTNGVDFLRQGTLSCSGASACLQNGSLVIKATAAGQEVALAVSSPANLTSFPFWDGIVQSDVPFDIVFQDKIRNKWIHMSANFCYEFEGNNGASQPLPAGRHEKQILVTEAYTWDGSALPSDAAINSVTFIAYAPGTIRVERCALTNGNTFTSVCPNDIYQLDDTTIQAIPLSHTVGDFCSNARLQLDTVRTTVKKQNGTASPKDAYVGTGDVITLDDGAQTRTYTAVVRGDLDASGTSTTADVRALLCSYIEGSLLSDVQRAAADIFTDRSIDTNDARLMLADILSALPMQYTQESVVGTETFLTQSKYNTFLSAATREAMMAGLKADLVPQGLAQSHKTKLLYMSAYSSSGGGSSVLVYDANGRFRAEYHIYTKGGSPCTAHLGGVAVTDTTLFLSYDGSGKYRVAAIPLTSLQTSGTQYVMVDTIYEMPVATSFLSYYDGYLWAGNFYLPSSGYDLMRTINYTTEGFGCYIAGFDMRTLGNDRLVPTGGNSYPTPDVLMAAPERVQGMAFDTKTNTVILSRSWGRKNDSSLDFHTVDLQAKAPTSIAINGTSVACFVLDSPAKTITTLPMTEGVTLDGFGGVKVLYESGANKYSDGVHRTDYIWRYRY